MNKLVLILSSIIYHLSSTSPVHAQDSFNVDLESQVSSRVAINEDLGTFITRLITAIIIVAGIATFIFMIMGGVQWVTSGGEKDKLQEAKAKITQAIVGLAVVAAAWAIFKLIDYFFGIGITT